MANYKTFKIKYREGLKGYHLVLANYITFKIKHHEGLKG